MTHWSRPWLGLPVAERGRTREGVDCWGVACLLYPEVSRTLYGVEVALPSYAGVKVSAEERAEVERIFRDELDGEDWRDVAAGAERPLDLAWFYRFEDLRPTHVGVVLRPGTMLHAHEGEHVTRYEDYRAAPWSKLLYGFRRHRLLMDAAHEA